MSRVFVGIGSNIEPEKNVRNALRLLSREFPIAGISTFYRTPAERQPEQPPFYNGVIEIETALPAADLKTCLRRIENVLGRKRTEDKFASRTIDLDIISSEDMQRPFVAIPLHELAPDLVQEPAKTGEMEPLPEFTEQLRSEIDYGLRKS